MNEEMMFTACNIPKFLEEQMNKMKDTLTGGMNEDNLKGFEYAVDTMLSILRQIIRAAEMDDEILVHSDKIAEWIRRVWFTWFVRTLWLQSCGKLTEEKCLML